MHLMEGNIDYIMSKTITWTVHCAATNKTVQLSKKSIGVSDMSTTRCIDGLKDCEHKLEDKVTVR